MTIDSTPTELLAAIVARPGMYWGNSANHFHSLSAFLSGYSVARFHSTNEEAHKRWEDLIPRDFSRFVADHFGESGYVAGSDWMRLIEERTRSDREALDLLLELRRLYDQKATSAAETTST